MFSKQKSWIITVFYKVPTCQYFIFQEDFKQWNARRLNINPSGANYVIQIVSSELSLLKTKLVSF
jgi:hypothetical protein